MPTPPMPGWNEPVATGTRSPIFREAFWPSDARIWGCCRSLLLLSVRRKFAVVAGMVIKTFVALRCASSFRLRLPGVDPVDAETVPFPVPTLVPDAVVVVVRLLCSCAVMLEGGWMPRLRIL